MYIVSVSVKRVWACTEHIGQIQWSVLCPSIASLFCQRGYFESAPLTVCVSVPLFTPILTNTFP